MSRVQALAAAGRSPNSKFHQLRLRYWDRSIDHICCVEGNEDLEYYVPFVRMHLSHRRVVDGFVAAGKGNVRECFFRARRNRWNSARIAFFVDSDLEAFVPPSTPNSANLYKTDFYSIESGCASSDFFEAVWVDLFHLSMTDARLGVWRARYEHALRSAAERLIVLFAAAIVCKRNQGNVDFDALNVVDLWRFDSLGNTSRKRYSKPKNPVLDPAIRLSYRDVASTVLALRTIDYRIWFRGKYVLAVAIAFLKVMKAALGARGASPRAVVKYQFSIENGVGCVASRAPLPASLSAFLIALKARADIGPTSP